MTEKIKSFFNPRLVVIFLYILFSFIAKPPIMPEIYITYSIYLLIGYSIIEIIKNGNLYWNKYLTWSFSIMLLCFFSILYAKRPEIVYNGLYNLLIPIVLSSAIVQLVKNVQDIKKILIVLALSGGILYLLMSMHGLFNITERLGNELFGNANAFASMILLSVMAAISSIYLSKNKFIWIVMIVILLLDYHMLFLSEGRKYLLAPLLFLLMLVFKSSDFKISGLIGVLVVILFAVPVVVNLLIEFDVISDSLIRRFEMMSAMLEGQSGYMGVGDLERKAMIDSGLDYFMMSPIFGNGHGNFSYLFSLDNSGGHIGHFSHNNYVELLCNLGLIGLIVYYIFYYKVLKCSLKQNTPACNIVFAFFIILMILEVGIVSYYSQIFLQMIICIASLAVFKSERIKL